MRKLVVCLVGSIALVGIPEAPSAATSTTLFSSSTPGVAGSPPVVPAGICAVTITAEGGRGGLFDGFTDIPGGAGASVTARVGVSPGDTLHALVGGAGGTGGGDDGSLIGDGGLGGGGGGGNGAPGGGGASVVWTTALVPLVVAGAGGGSNGQFSGGAGGLLGQPGGDGGTNGIGGVGPRSGKGGKADGTGGVGGGGALDYAGGGGGGVGTGGAAGDNAPPNRDGGPGGTGNGTVGGAGGSGGGSGSNGVVGGAPPGSGNGGAGGFGDGGAGVVPGGDAGTPPTTAGAGGGGGVGFGGGGGAGSGPSGGSAGGGAGYGAGGGAAGDGGGGGGGGSSFVTPSALSSSSAPSVRSGDGQVTITYDATTDACPPPTDPRPDGRVKVGQTGTLLGNDVYNGTGTDQTAEGSAGRGRTATYYVSVQNDAPFADALVLDGTTGDGSFIVRYTTPGGVNITPAMVAGTYTTPVLAAGATQLIKVVVKVTSRAPVGARLRATLNATSVADGAFADTVGFTTTRS